MWFEIGPADLGFAQSAPFQLESEVIINASPQRVFEIVSTVEGPSEWLHEFTACRWMSPEPHGPGTTRELEMKLLTAKARFLLWEPGKRLSYTIIGMSMPLVRRLLEDLRFEPLGDRTRFRWTLHYTPAPLLKAIHPLGRRLLGKRLAATAYGLAAYANRTS
jgi:uncharacterized protein YndB with AHSA1/START domain